MKGYQSAYPLFDEKPAPAVTIPAADPHVREQDKPRLSGNNLAVLRRLQQGPARSTELIGDPYGVRPHARVFDLKKAGCVIKKETVESGVALYTLVRCPEELA